MNFKEYIHEEKIKHLTHLDDLPILYGENGANEALRILKDVYADIQKHQITDTQLKVDGSVSLISGTNPENGKKFIATKSLFNKTPKINYTDEDIEQNHGKNPELVKILKIALKLLPDTVKKGIMQGDLMYTKNDLEYKTIDSTKGVGFLPNTVYYFVPEDTPLYNNISKSKIGIIWHTNYTGNTIDSLSASFNVNDSMIQSTKDAYVKTPMVKLDSLGWTKKEEKIILDNIKTLEQYKSQINWKAVEEIVNSEYSKEIMIYINDKVKNNQKSFKNEIGNFIDFIKSRYQISIDKLKSQKGKDKKTQKMNDIINQIRTHADSLYKLFNFSSSIEAVKDIYVSKMNELKFGAVTYYKTDKGYIPADVEGWVISDGGTNVKFVNRPAFSRTNMLYSKYS
jgi:hypothetical protein